MRSNKPDVIPPCNLCVNKDDNKLFCKLSKIELEGISSLKLYNFYKKGQVIFYEGNTPQGLYCIYTGKVKVNKLGEGGKEQIVRFAGPSDLLGYRALLSGEFYNASATCLEDTALCFIPRNGFMEILQRNPDMLMQTIQILTQDLKHAERKIMNMAQKPVRERIAEALLVLKECYGTGPDGETINSTLTRRDIASIAGTTTETTIRVLSDLKNSGTVSFEGKYILIKQLRDLVKLANLSE